MLGRFTPQGRVTVMNREASIRRGGATEHFSLDLPELEALRVPAVPDWY
jgi:hypothetical protein